MRSGFTRIPTGWSSLTLALRACWRLSLSRTISRSSWGCASRSRSRRERARISSRIRTPILLQDGSSQQRRI